MPVLRAQNFVSQGRIDLPHLRSLESSAQADWDLGLGQMIAGKAPLILSGFNIPVGVSTISNPASNLTVNVAGGVLIHYNASDAGSIFLVGVLRTTEQLISTNPKVFGSFIASGTNYIGLDLIRTADATTVDTVQFIDPLTEKETPKSVPLARTLDYKIIIQSTAFSGTPNVCPIAQVITDANLNVVSVEDARRMMFRLGSGGDTPNAFTQFSWANSRTENPITLSSGSTDPFIATDKSISSMKTWMDAIMERLWELGGGEYWYSPTADRNIRLIFNTPSILTDNVSINGALGVKWEGLSLVFDNSTAYFNTITDSTAGFTTLANGQCLYVDLNRNSSGSPLTMQGPTSLISLGQPTSSSLGQGPGNRYVIIWCQNSKIYVRNKEYWVGKPTTVATTSIVGNVRSIVDNAGAAGLGTSVVASDGSVTDPVAPLVDTTNNTNGTNLSVVAAGLTRGKSGSFGVGAGTLLIGGGSSDTNVHIDAFSNVRYQNQFSK